MVEIHRVGQYARASEALWGGWIDSPASKQSFEVQDFEIHGWALGRGMRIAAVEVVVDHPVFRNSPHWKPTPVQVVRPRFERPDVAANYPPEPHSTQCGFRLTIGAIGLPRRFELHVRAVFEDNSRALIGRIEGSRQPLQSSYSPELQPIILTFLGRTGSTLVMQMLARHPEVVAHQEYPYETRSAAHWLHMLRVVASPPEHFQALHLRGCEHQRAWVGQHPFYTLPLTDNPLLHQWFGRTYPQMLASFCQQSIDAFYQEVARAQEQPPPRRFIEKWGIGSPHGLLADLYPQAKELLLVRDFRDMACSMLAFGAKGTGFDGARQQRYNSESDYIRSLQIDALWLLDRYRSAEPRPHLLRYEDLVLQPQETLGSVLKYLELDDSPEVIEAMIDAVGQRDVLQRHQTSSGPGSSMGRWQRDLSHPLQAACEEAFSEVLEEFGYAGAAVPG